MNTSQTKQDANEHHATAGITRRRLAKGAAWSVPAVLVATPAQASTASPLTCGETGLQPFPADITLYNREGGTSPGTVTDNRLPYTSNGWTARRVGGVFAGNIRFAAGDYVITADAMFGEELFTYVTATAATVVGCSYTVAVPYRLSGTDNPRPIQAWITVDGGDFAGIHSNNVPLTGTLLYTFIATSTTTQIGIKTRVSASATVRKAAAARLTAPTVSCDCP